MQLVIVGVGETVKVEQKSAHDYVKARFLVLWLTKGADVAVLRKGPKNNLTVYRIRGAMIALRNEESKFIEVL